MQRIYQNTLLIAVLFLTSQQLLAQADTTSQPLSVNPALQEIFNSKISKKYTIAGITVVGTKAFDQNLIISISGLAV
jgi:outer membrane protein insertion porin family